jgi:hypothetical protein
VAGAHERFADELNSSSPLDGVPDLLAPTPSAWRPRLFILLGQIERRWLDAADTTSSAAAPAPPCDRIQLVAAAPTTAATRAAPRDHIRLVAVARPLPLLTQMDGD